MTDRYTVENAVASLKNDERGIYGVLLEHGTLQLGYYRPQGSDPQQPHDRDEIYVVQSGHGVFMQGGERQEFEPGEALFVPAGVEHRFEEFSDDFAAWVIFYGPKGGEAQ
ncbi:MAG: cupin domain-containing protein [Gammaproteobacteria bacterium]|nr:cupin domain-containing protein [Gammaproteobacteria bacterium]